MENKNNLILCYNKGCGKKFDPNENTEDACIYHPGEPVFHDAYKGWGCCGKRCTDFTEFLNIKGCTISFHNEEKPIEPPKVAIDKSKASEVIEYRAPKPISEEYVERPALDSPMIKLIPTVSTVLRQQLKDSAQNPVDLSAAYDGKGEIPIGTSCKNNGCKQVYEDSSTLSTLCVHHPGYPVFHEGMKFWTCCNKRTSDFNAFLEQVGCSTDEHKWFKVKAAGSVNCRLDWHQTGSLVVVSIFAKNYDPDCSSIQLSPVRLKVSLLFPTGNGRYENDLELRGVVRVEDSSVQMLPTKVEIKLKKSTGASWSHLAFPKTDKKITSKEVTGNRNTTISLEEQIDSVDLSDL